MGRAGHGGPTSRAARSPGSTSGRATAPRSCGAKGPLEGGFPGVFANCRKLPKICEIWGFWISTGNAPEMSEITGKLPETSDYGPQSDVSGNFPVIVGAFPAKIKNP